MKAYEVNFDGLPGVTHHFGGLSPGNIKSMAHKYHVSSPQKAALQSLAKMKLLMDLGVKQALFPPHPRPDFGILKRMGYLGEAQEVLKSVKAENPRLLEFCSSSSFMWAANSMTMTPSWDSTLNKTQFTPSNLHFTFHRSLESDFVYKMAKQIFKPNGHFALHTPLPHGAGFLGDEGAANQHRICKDYGMPGLYIFAYGVSTSPHVLARQSLDASKAIVRLHRLSEDLIIYAKQSSVGLKAGAFHTDLLLIGNKETFLVHELAFENQKALLKQVKERAAALNIPVKIHVVKDSQIPLKDVIKSYFFNGQMISLSSGEQALVLPTECKDFPSVQVYVAELLKKGVVKEVLYVDVSQSLKNGGGPACLRLRVLLNEEELAQVKRTVFLTEGLYKTLVKWVEEYYRSELSPEDLADRALMEESRASLGALEGILELEIL